MGFLNKFFGCKLIDSRLIGKWMGDTPEISNTQITFTSNGELIYEIFEDEKISILNMTFNTTGDLIISNQPSHPSIEKTRYSISGDLLTLKYEEEIQRFRKKEK